MKESDIKKNESEQQSGKVPTKRSNNDDDNDNYLSDRAKELQKVEQSEEKINKFLQEQLNHARQEKANLEASMEARAKSFQNTLAKLQINQNNSIDSNPSSTQLPSSPTSIINVSDTNNITTTTTTTAATTATTATSIPTVDSQKLILNSEDPVLLKKELEKVLEIVRQQESEVKKLKFELEMEQGHVNILRHDNQMLRQKTVNMHASAEQEEEFISNKLLKRISNLKKEKGELLLQVEQEEEYLTNTLQKKLNQLQKEKIDMENAFEQEQEYIVNRLQKQLDSLRQEQQQQQQSPHHMYHLHNHSPHYSRENSGSSISSNSSNTSNTSTVANAIHQLPQPSSSPSSIHKKWIQNYGSSLPTSPSSESNNGLIDVLKLEINGLRSKIGEMEKEYISKSSQATRFKNELIELRKKSGLQVDDLLSEETSSIFRPNNNHQKTTRRTSSVSISGSNINNNNNNNSSNHNPVNSIKTPLGRNRSVSTSDVRANNGGGILGSPAFISSSSPLAYPLKSIPSSSSTGKPKN